MSEVLFYPRHEEVDFADKSCVNCGHQLFTRGCPECCGDGYHDVYDEDPLFYDPGDVRDCDNCRGQGYHLWCPRCRWDALLPAKHNHPEHRGMAIMRLTDVPHGRTT